MKLELKYIAPYLPYGLKMIFEKSGRIIELAGIQKTDANNLIFIQKYGQFYEETIWKFKPILRPLSDLTKEIEHNGEKFVPIEWFEIGDDENLCPDYGNGNIKLISLLKDMSKHNFIDLNYMQYGVIEKLLEWHFDIFGLLEQGLAVDFNSL